MSMHIERTAIFTVSIVTSLLQRAQGAPIQLGGVTSIKTHLVTHLVAVNTLHCLLSP
jgi:hypothetical protein